MSSQYVILTVTPAGPRLRPQFTLQLPTSLTQLAIDCLELSFECQDYNLGITDSLVTYKRNGRITHPSIHQWIVDKSLNLTASRNPAKLIFKLSIVRNIHHFTLYTAQGNLLT